jgi:hypothetical protein
MRKLVLVIIGIFALFILIRAYSDMRVDRVTVLENPAVEASLQ